MAKQGEFLLAKKASLQVDCRAMCLVCFLKQESLWAMILQVLQEADGLEKKKSGKSLLLDPRFWP